MKPLFLIPLIAMASVASADQLETGTKAIQSQTGCYLVDYSYAETEGLQPGYKRDKRVYDVNARQSIKEWIYAETISPTRIRLQHILFGTDLAGNIMEGSFLKHQAEDWEYDAKFLYDFSKPLTWEVKRLNPGLWTRRITNLDDGLRYQCASSFIEENAYSDWSCNNYAPIPGRETRDMGRKDYNTLDRTTRVITYGNSWLERQANTKTIDKNGVRTPLAKELGKTWYVRLPDDECFDAKAFANERKVFWTLLRETWDEILDGHTTYVEKSQATPRYAKIFELEDKVHLQDLDDPAIRKSVKDQIMAIIGDYQ
ncbi:MAG: hypothetical protein JST80_12620 [Bdellovibrionales bacterium]|nr:hypothetical protein [Bdellovibrionales bacterium]